jgi:hypothetical protein
MSIALDPPLMDEETGLGILPFDYLVGFIRFLHRNRRHIRIITYNDLDWDRDYNPDSMYETELKAWKRRPRLRFWERNKIHVLLQHDVDTIPKRSMQFARIEEQFRIPSNFMVFNRRISRYAFRETGQLQYTSYELDWDLLKSLESKGFVIGYHSNAYERSYFDMARAIGIFQEDIRDLRARVKNVRFFSPHGGHKDPQGRTNNCLPIDQSLQKQLKIRWVHNSRGVIFNGYYSDGGMRSRPADDLNLLRFVKTWQPGNRYRVLIHPQYYGLLSNTNVDSIAEFLYQAPRNIESAAWYRQVIEAYCNKNIVGQDRFPLWDELQYSPARQCIISHHELDA